MRYLRLGIACLLLLALTACANSTEPSCGSVTTFPLLPQHGAVDTLWATAQMCVTPYNPWWEN